MVFGIVGAQKVWKHVDISFGVFECEVTPDTRQKRSDHSLGDGHANERRSRSPPIKKVKLYDQILRRFIVYREKLTEKTAQVVVHEKEDFPEGEIQHGVTKQYKKKTEELLDFIKSNSSFGWNDSGEFVYDDRAVASTNIKDLIAAAARNTKKSRLPGWNEFQKALQDFQGPQPPSTSRKRKLKWETFK